jgi:hypothetical protein
VRTRDPERAEPGEPDADGAARAVRAMTAPMLLLIVGPPAVGKMTVGLEVERRTGLRLFHNHHTVELALRFFPFGSPPYRRVVGDIRRQIMEEVAASELPGLIFTFVRVFDEPRDTESLASFAAIFRARGGRVVTAELSASQEERLRRNETPLRLAEKPSKRDVPASRARLLADDARYRLSSRGELDAADYLRIDNTDLEPAEVAARIIAAFGIPSLGAAD